MVFSTHGVARLIDLSSVIFHSKLYHVTIIQPIRSYFPNFWYCMKAFKMFHPSISLVMGSSAWKMVWASPRRFELWIPNIWGICSTSQINGNFELFTKLKKNRSVNKTPCFIVNEVFVGHCSGEINREFQKHGAKKQSENASVHWWIQPTIANNTMWNQRSHLGLTSFSFFLGGVPRNTRLLSSIETTRQTWRQNPTVS